MKIIRAVKEEGYQRAVHGLTTLQTLYCTIRDNILILQITIELCEESIFEPKIHSILIIFQRSNFDRPIKVFTIGDC